MRTICLALVALLCCATSHAATITADAVFEFFFHGGDGGPIIDPPITGEGSFSMRENRWAAFSFDMFGHHWSIDDVDPIFCHPAAFCFPNESGSELEVMQIEFADEAGSGFFSGTFSRAFSPGVSIWEISARAEQATMGPSPSNSWS